MASAMRRQANVWAMGHAAPQPLTFPEAQGPDLPEGNNGFSVWWARSGPYPAGCSAIARTTRMDPYPGRPSSISGGVFDHGTYDEDGPVTWEALASPRYIPVWRT